jgi:hypothetical protein
MRFPYLFNFAASSRGGGLKRLEEYSRWFDARGGAAFAIHHSCARMAAQFPESVVGRLLQDGDYLKEIVGEIGSIDFYYAYGIPVYRPIGGTNWFHLSNVMPFNFWRYRLPLIDYVKQPMLALRYQQNLKHADIVSAESHASLEFLKVGDRSKLFVSVNGSDDELARAATPQVACAESVAVVVGTYSYKAIQDSYRVYQYLKSREFDLRLTIIGDAGKVPSSVRRDRSVRCTGLLPRDEVVRILDRASYYISTTRLENSYNAASEGIFLARKSYISAIPPHRELLAGQDIEFVSIPSVRDAMILVERQALSSRALKTWDEVVTGMLARAGMADG